MTHLERAAEEFGEAMHDRIDQLTAQACERIEDRLRRIFEDALDDRIDEEFDRAGHDRSIRLRVFAEFASRIADRARELETDEAA